MRNAAYHNIEDEILGKSFDYLTKNGLENVSLRELCKATEISMGSIYYWFSGKDELIIDTVRYGLDKVADSLFAFAFENIYNLDRFFNESIHEISRHKLSLRFIYQVTTSPVYGPRMRQKAEDLKVTYDRYTKKLSAIFECSPERIAPIVFMYISIIMDYIVWEDYESSSLQMNFLKLFVEREFSLNDKRSFLINR